MWRLCSQQRLWSVFAKRKGSKNRKQGPPVHDDLVQHRFTAAVADELWLTDITEHCTGEGKLYLCAIKDVFSNRIVGYSINDRMTAELAVGRCGWLSNGVGRRERRSTRSEEVSFDAGASCTPSAAPGSPDPWVESAPRATTQRWNRSSHSFRRTSWTNTPGRLGRSCS